MRGSSTPRPSPALPDIVARRMVPELSLFVHRRAANVLLFGAFFVVSELVAVA